MLSRKMKSNRRGAAAVEFAMVAQVVIFFLFGMFEFCRFTWCLQAVENAAREGARYAVVNTANGTNADVQLQVTNLMGGTNNQLSNFTVVVAKVDPTNGNFLDANNNVVATAALAPFNNAGFGDSISVTITANFNPVLAKFLALPTAVPMQSRSVMTSEGYFPDRF